MSTTKLILVVAIALCGGCISTIPQTKYKKMHQGQDYTLYQAMMSYLGEEISTIWKFGGRDN